MLDMCAAPGGKSLISLLTKLPGYFSEFLKQKGKKLQIKSSATISNYPDWAIWSDLWQCTFRWTQRKQVEFHISPFKTKLIYWFSGRVIIKRKNASNWDGWDELKCYDKVGNLIFFFWIPYIFLKGISYPLSKWDFFLYPCIRKYIGRLPIRLWIRALIDLIIPF